MRTTLSVPRPAPHRNLWSGLGIRYTHSAACSASRRMSWDPVWVVDLSMSWVGNAVPVDVLLKDMAVLGDENPARTLVRAMADPAPGFAFYRLPSRL